MKPAPISEDDLHAWADGRLEATRRAEVEAWLAEHPQEAAALAAWRQQNARLHAIFDPVLAEAVPARLRAAVAGERWRPPRAAAALGWLALGAVLGAMWNTPGWNAPGGARHADDHAQPADALIELPRRAAIAHAVYAPEQRHPVEVGADNEQHLVAWLSKRLGTPLRVPELGALGYHLMGGRLLAAEAGPGAQFMYDNAAGERLTLYVSAARSGGTAASLPSFRFAEEEGISVFYWAENGFAYALSARQPRTALLPVADAVYRQLAP